MTSSNSGPIRSGLTVRACVLVLLGGAVGMPVAGCGDLETQPLGVEESDEDRAFEMSDEYIEGEREG